MKIRQTIWFFFSRKTSKAEKHGTTRRRVNKIKPKSAQNSFLSPANAHFRNNVAPRSDLRVQKKKNTQSRLFYAEKTANNNEPTLLRIDCSMAKVFIFPEYLQRVRSCCENNYFWDRAFCAIDDFSTVSERKSSLK